jgi:hypothetical protein
LRFSKAFETLPDAFYHPLDCPANAHGNCLGGILRRRFAASSFLEIQALLAVENTRVEGRISTIFVVKIGDVDVLPAISWVKIVCITERVRVGVLAL